MINFYSFKNKSYFLIGLKYYNSNSSSIQGPGSNGSDANFNFQNSLYPNYNNQSDYTYPNKNIALFGENIFYDNIFGEKIFDNNIFDPIGSLVSTLLVSNV